MELVQAEKDKMKEERKWLEDALASRWLQEAREPVAEAKGEVGSGALTVPAKRVRINVGGQVFETTGRVLLRDPGSALARLATEEPPKDAPDGAWFFERDWWTFRFVMQWLREGEASLPRSKPILRAMYAEARFFGMAGLRGAVRRIYQRMAAAEAEADDVMAAGPSADGGAPALSAISRAFA